jgi:hypothetical protein
MPPESKQNSFEAAKANILKRLDTGWRPLGGLPGSVLVT